MCIHDGVYNIKNTCIHTTTCYTSACPYMSVDVASSRHCSFHTMAQAIFPHGLPCNTRNWPNTKSISYDISFTCMCIGSVAPLCCRTLLLLFFACLGMLSPQRESSELSDGDHHKKKKCAVHFIPIHPHSWL